MSPDAPSLKMVSPEKWRYCDSRPYPVGKRPGVLQMNWSVETKSPTLYWSFMIAHSWSSISCDHQTFGVRFLACAKRHQWQGGTIQFLAETGCGLIMAGRIVLLPYGFIMLILHHFLKMQYMLMLMPNFQCLVIEKFFLRNRKVFFLICPHTCFAY
jgi:hypothetical protein